MIVIWVARFGPGVTGHGLISSASAPLIMKPVMSDNNHLMEREGGGAVTDEFLFSTSFPQSPNCNISHFSFRSAFCFMIISRVAASRIRGLMLKSLPNDDHKTPDRSYSLNLRTFPV